MNDADEPEETFYIFPPQGHNMTIQEIIDVVKEGIEPPPRDKAEAGLNALLVVVLGAVTGGMLLMLAEIAGEARATATALCMLLAWAALYIAWTRP